MRQQAPFLHCGDRVSRHYTDILIALLPTLILPTLYYGLRPLLLVLTGLCAAVLCELIGCACMHRRPTVGDGSAAATGALIGALMSPLCPYWMPAIGAAFAIWVVKLPFGGSGRYLFSPAAAALALLTQCWPHRLFTYPVLSTPLPLTVEVPLASVVTETSPAGQLFTGAYTVNDRMTLLLGMAPGPIAATSVLVLLAAAVFLCIRRSAFLWVTCPYVVTCAVFALLFPRMDGALLNGVITELCSGYLLFAGVFLLNSCITPCSRPGRIAYGVLAGLLVMLLRHFGQFEEGACFAVLLANAAAPLLDRWGWRLQAFWLRRRERKEALRA